MKNKITSMKKLVLTAVTVVTGLFASNAISEGGIVETSYANPALDKYIDLNIQFNGTGDDVTVDDSQVQDASSALNKVVKFIKWIALGGTLLLLGVFVVNLIKMGAAGTNIQARTAAQQGLVWSGVSAAILSIATSIFFFLQGALK